MKRFWTSAEAVPMVDGWSVALDGRPVRTPARAALEVSTRALADAIAAEWSAVAETIDPRAMPLTGLANAAIDRVAPDPAGFATALAAYAGGDVLLYRAAEPAELVMRQHVAWDPPLAWAARRYDVAFTPVIGIGHVPQPAATLARLGAAFAVLDPFRLAALHPVVTVSGSAVLALALAEGELGADQVWAAGQLDELWQAERWGEDPLATAARADRRGALDAGAAMLRLLSS